MLDEWAHEEFLVDNITGAIELNESARSHYRELGDHSAESRALAQGAYFYESAGKRDRAEELARQAVDVLGTDRNGADLARALEVNAYLQWMAGNFGAVPCLVDQTIEAGGEQIDERILIRSLTYLGVAATIANYPEGRASFDEARERAEAAGQWYEEGRALVNHAWAAAEARDLPVASDYAQRAIASAVRHELPMVEGYSRAMYARVLDLKCEWSEAEDLARDLVDAAAVT